MLIRKMNSEDLSNIMKVAKTLPQWFAEGGLAFLSKDIPFQSGIIAEENGFIGFLTFYVNQGVATIGWMGVLPSNHRVGVGSQLLIELKKILAIHKIKTIVVSTLGDSVDYEPYNRTRSFYRKNGFVDFQKIPYPESRARRRTYTSLRKLMNIFRNAYV